MIVTKFENHFKKFDNVEVINDCMEKIILQTRVTLNNECYMNQYVIPIRNIYLYDNYTLHILLNGVEQEINEQINHMFKNHNYLIGGNKND